MNPLIDDEDEDRDEMLKSLLGEVDDYSAKSLPDAAKGAGVTIEISVKPHGSDGAEEKGEEGVEMPEGKEGEEEDGHDMVAHMLGMCGGGCAYE